ncbi:MAG: bifunctional oligoribonuclease/PAP phosphatase NrnA [Deltaproteobacteria bacterium]|nr:bifunctional oligoribonuclease/PAP phosphatase NrnA [Deltaproteobacteria bacterium]MBW2658083.1 bifunctional oligoribonuclease/PAP phosphatase NrnA [Deltaproteobacteria bacterium]
MTEKPGIIPEEIVQTIAGKGNIVLLTHVHPDGDALGSLFGFAEILELSGKNVFCFLEESVSHLYDFLPGCERADSSLDSLAEFVDGAGADIMVIALDCGDEYRLGKYKEEFLQIVPFAVIDHHLSHRNFGTLRWVDPAGSSTGEMIYELALALDTDINFKAAYNLYVAICTDTGSFRYDCTGARTLHIAAELVEKGVLPQEVCGKLYDNYSRERLKLMELVLATVTLYEGGQVAFMHMTQMMLEKSGATMNDVEGFIDYPRSLRSVLVAVFVKEGAGNQVSVSLRAKGKFDVAAIAKIFGGGGHRNAAGFRVFDTTVEKVQSQLENEISTALTRA